ncbi:MAG: hypothetical protein KIT13_07845, partial [Burkholderiales bacterium]|nr:hypothetical protein [Burkholderiales bacterium]
MYNPSRLVLRPSGIYFRLTVPERLRPLVGRREIVRALPATSRRQAQHIANRLCVGLQKLFAQIDKGDALAFDSNKVAKIIAKWLDQQLADDEHHRALGGRRAPSDLEAAEAGLSDVLDDYRDALRENDFRLVGD